MVCHYKSTCHNGNFRLWYSSITIAAMQCNDCTAAVASPAKVQLPCCTSALHCLLVPTQAAPSRYQHQRLHSSPCHVSSLALAINRHKEAPVFLAARAAERLSARLAAITTTNLTSGCHVLPPDKQYYCDGLALATKDTREHCLPSRHHHFRH
jgi:hypothetical protein